MTQLVVYKMGTQTEEDLRNDQQSALFISARKIKYRTS